MNTVVLGRVRSGQHLSMAEMAQVVGEIMGGTWKDEEIGLLLTGLRTNGETAEEIAGAAQAMRQHMVPIHYSQGKELIDTCGTGGDGSGTFNISTAAAIVTAAAGVPVAKHGNRKITSKSGSADVLKELGVNIEADVETVQKCLDQVGICFCFAPQLHVAMKNVAPIRQKLGVPTIFNLLGPLSNPASAPYQLLGVGNAELRTTLASALFMLGTRRSTVVRGRDGLDEVALSGPTDVSEVTADGVRELIWTPEEFGLKRAGQESMRAEGPSESAAMIQAILDGMEGPARDIVILNSAAALWTAGRHESPTDCAGRAAEAISDGTSAQLLRDLAQVSHAC